MNIFSHHGLPIKYWLWIIVLTLLCVTCNLSSEQPSSSEKHPLLPGSVVNPYLQAKHTNLDSSLYHLEFILDYIKANQLPDSYYIYFNTEKATILTKIGRQEEALNPHLENYLLARSIPDSGLVARTALGLANHYNTIYQVPLALPYLQQAVEYYKNYPNSFEAAKTLGNLGRVYLDTGKLYDALELFNRAAEIYASQKDSLNMAYNLSDIGYTLIQLNQVEAGVAATREGIQILEAIQNQLDVGMALGNLALNYKKIYPDSAILYQQKAIDLSAALGDSLNWIAAKYNFANVLYELKNYTEAERIYQEVNRFCANKQIDHGLMMSMSGLGSLYLKTGQLNKAIRFLNEAGSMVEEKGATLLIIENLKTLGEVQRQLGNIAAAQKTEQRVDSLRQQMELSQTQSTLKYIQQSMEAEQELFNQKILEKKSLEASALLQRRNAIAILICSFLVLGTLLWYQWRITYKSGQQAVNQLLKRYAEEIEAQKQGQTILTKQSNEAQLAKRLQELLETEKIFLQSNLKAEDVLNFLDITYKDLHHLLKEHLNTTFPNLINE